MSLLAFGIKGQPHNINNQYKQNKEKAFFHTGFPPFKHQEIFSPSNSFCSGSFPKTPVLIVTPLTQILLLKRDLAKSTVFLPAWLSTSLPG
jgi:hypothetical protein